MKVGILNHTFNKKTPYLPKLTNKEMRIKIKYIYPIIWLSLVCYASLTPSSNIPKIHVFPHFDKVVHFGFYAIFSILLIPIFIRNQKYGSAYTFAVILSIIIGSLIEALQFYLTISRSASVLDEIANITGALTGVVFYQLILRKSVIERKFFRIE